MKERHRKTKTLLCVISVAVLVACALPRVRAAGSAFVPAWPRDTSHLAAMFTSRPWHELGPDCKHEARVEGYGTYFDMTGKDPGMSSVRTMPRRPSAWTARS